jgi:uncharacterized membrane protein
MSLAIALHALAAVIWVGGMFFAHQVLRPVAVDRLEPPQRLPVWVGVFGRFFPWVWAAVVLLPATGYWIIFAVLGGMGHAGLHIHIMNGIGLVMIALFIYLFFAPYPRLKRAVAEQDWPRGAQHLATIRRIVGTNLLLGLITIAVASGGRYL